MAHTYTNVPVPAEAMGGISPFDQIRRTDAYGREYWIGGDLQPQMQYSQRRDFIAVIKKAKASLALVQGETAAQDHFAEMRNMVAIGSGAQRGIQDYRLTRFGAYLVAMAGDDTKEAVARARVYFAVRTREAELGAITTEEIRRTALARAREMVDYQVFRDMMRDHATDYAPSSRESRFFFAAMQNKLYRHLTGMTAEQIKNARELQTWPGVDEGKPEPSLRSAARKVAKNYLAAKELNKLDRMVSRLCLAAEEIAEDSQSLPLSQWEVLVDNELAMSSRRLLAA